MSFNEAAGKTCLYNDQETVTEKRSANLPCGTQSADWGLFSSCPSCLAHMLQKQVSANGACPHAQERAKCIVLHVLVEWGSGQPATNSRS